MRRCPKCLSPNADSAGLCAACGEGLPRALWSPRAAFTELWDAPSFVRVALAILPVLCFRLSFGGLLTVGLQRVEWRFAVYHLCHGLLLAAGLAWAWRETSFKGRVRWLAAGLCGGLLAEALETWYTYHGLMGFFSLALWQWFGLPEDRALVYEILQMLRLAGPGLFLWLAYAAKPLSAFRRSSALVWIVLALVLRSQVRGAWVVWGALTTAMGCRQAALYALSTLVLVWGLGPRRLDAGHPNPLIS
jgi:hypothetical protein